ncbi:MAG: C45 family peptidase [Gemmataceae bacterium]
MHLSLVLGSLLAAVAPPVEAPSFQFPEGKVAAGAQLQYLGKVPVLTVEGTREEMGSAVGRLALKPGSRVLEYPRDLLVLRKVDYLWAYFKGAGKALYRNFPADARTELEAIARAAGVDRDLVICGNTFFDLKKVFACSALLVEGSRSSTGGPLLARNLDYPSLGYIHEYSLVTVYRPRGKLAFASVGFPGLVGVLSGMNEAGLAVGVLEVFDAREGQSNFDRSGIPYGLCLRQVLEEARTIPEACKVLERLKRTTTINVAIADRHTVGVLEVSPGKVVLRSSLDGMCVTTNHFCSGDLKAKKPANINKTFERFAELERLRKVETRQSPDLLRQRLDAVNLGSLTLQTMVFEPQALRLHLAMGKVPSSALPLQTLDLTPLLRGKSDRR